MDFSLLGDALGYIAQVQEATSGAAFGFGCVALGAVAAKVCVEVGEADYERRLVEVQEHAALRVAPGLLLTEVLRELLLALDACLAVEEDRRMRLNALEQGFGLFSTSKTTCEAVGAEGLIGSAERAELDLRRQLRHIRKFVQKPPAPAPGSGGSRRGSSSDSRRGSRRQGRRRPDEEAYEKLFNPQYKAVSDPPGIAAALCYLVASFLELRMFENGDPGVPRGSRQGGDARRGSLRYAVAALARHPLLDADAPAAPGAEGKFRRGARALLCFLDVALAWRPVDPFGWTGTCADRETSTLLAESRLLGVASYPIFATGIRKNLRSAADGCGVIWRRLEAHFDVLRVRTLPANWAAAWVQAEDASVLVRNHTKVPLRIELHRPPSRPNPLADLPLIRDVLAWQSIFVDDAGPVMTANVGPEVEWALRPQIQDGRQFQVRILSQAGVVVCSRTLRRGQSMDFSVKLPPKPWILAASPSSHQAGSAEKPPKDSQQDEEVASTRAPSTSAPSTVRRDSGTESSSGILSVPTVAEQPDSVGGGLAAACASQSGPGLRVQVPTLQQMPLKFAVCTLCLKTMRPCSNRPTNAVYSGGVECDRCQVELIRPPPQSAAHSERRGSSRHRRSDRQGSRSRREVQVDPAEELRRSKARHREAQRDRSPSSETASEVSSATASTSRGSGAGTTTSATDAVRFFHCHRCWFDLCEKCALREMHQIWWADD